MTGNNIDLKLSMVKKKKVFGIEIKKNASIVPFVLVFCSLIMHCFVVSEVCTHLLCCNKSNFSLIILVRSLPNHQIKAGFYSGEKKRTRKLEKKERSSLIL